MRFATISSRHRRFDSSFQGTSRGAPSEINDLVENCEAHQSGEGIDIEFEFNLRPVRIHCFHTDPQDRGNGLIGLAQGKKPDHFAFPRRKDPNLRLSFRTFLGVGWQSRRRASAGCYRRCGFRRRMKWRLLLSACIVRNVHYLNSFYQEI